MAFMKSQASNNSKFHQTYIALKFEFELMKVFSSANIIFVIVWSLVKYIVMIHLFSVLADNWWVFNTLIAF
jgi:hypothetical protein